MQLPTRDSTAPLVSPPRNASEGRFVEGAVLQRGDINMKLEETAVRPSRQPAWLSQGPGGIVVNVRVSPGAKRFAIDASGDELRIRLTAAPEKGAANEELVARLGGLLGAEVRITHGWKSRRKKLLITGRDAANKLVTLTKSRGAEAPFA